MMEAETTAQQWYGRFLICYRSWEDDKDIIHRYCDNCNYVATLLQLKMIFNQFLENKREPFF